MIPNKIPRYLALVGMFILAACDRGPTELRLAQPASDLDAEIVAELATMLDKGARFSMQISGNGAVGEDALDMLLNGEADLALVSNFLPYREGIGTVTPVYPTVLHIAYRQNRDASSGIDLLSDARVFAGADGSASRMMFDRIASRIGLSAGSYQFVGAEELDGDEPPDVLVVFAPITPARAREFEGYHLYSLGMPADIGAGSVVDAATLADPKLRAFVIPQNIYGLANPNPIVTVAVDKMLVARSDLDASIVYDLIDEIRRARPALAAGRPGLFESTAIEAGIARSTFVLHNGAQDYLQRDEPTVYERYSGVAEVVVTLLIGLVSATFAAIRILKIRRKNRIDEYYSAALKLRDRLAAAETAEARDAVIVELQNLQDTAFEHLVDEKLSADDSFQIFITLSNDILRQYSSTSR